MRCQNLAGTVEVVLRILPEHLLDPPPSEFEARQVSGCTSPLTTVTFTLPASPGWSKSSAAAVYVFDAWGAVLARVAVPKTPH